MNGPLTWRPWSWLYKAAVFLVFWLPLLLALWFVGNTAYNTFLRTGVFWWSMYSTFFQGWRLFLIPVIATGVTLPVLMGLRRADQMMHTLFRSLDREWQEIFTRDAGQLLKNKGFFCGELGVWMTPVTPRCFGPVVIPWRALDSVEWNEEKPGRLRLRDVHGREYFCVVQWHPLGGKGLYELLREKAPWCFGEPRPFEWWDFESAPAMAAGRPKPPVRLRLRFALRFSWLPRVLWLATCVAPWLLVAAFFVRSIYRSQAFELWEAVLSTFRDHWPLLLIPVAIQAAFSWLVEAMERRSDLLRERFVQLRDERWQRLFLYDVRRLHRQRGFFCGQTGVWFFTLGAGVQGLAGHAMIPYHQLAGAYRENGKLVLYDHSGRRYRYRSVAPLRSAEQAMELLAAHAPWSVKAGRPADSAASAFAKTPAAAQLRRKRFAKRFGWRWRAARFVVRVVPWLLILCYLLFGTIDRSRGGVALMSGSISVTQDGAGLVDGLVDGVVEGVTQSARNVSAAFRRTVEDGVVLLLLPLLAQMLLGWALRGLYRPYLALQKQFEAMDVQQQEQFLRETRDLWKRGGFHCSLMGVWFFVRSFGEDMRYGYVFVPYTQLIGVAREGSHLVVKDKKGGEYRYHSLPLMCAADEAVARLEHRAPWCLLPERQGAGAQPPGPGARLQAHGRAVAQRWRSVGLHFGVSYAVLCALTYVVPWVVALGFYIRERRAPSASLHAVPAIVAWMQGHWMLVFPAVFAVAFGWAVRQMRRSLRQLEAQFLVLDDKRRERFLQDGRDARRGKGFHCGELGVWFIAWRCGAERTLGFVHIPYRDMESVVRDGEGLVIRDVAGREYHYRGILGMCSADSALDMLAEHAGWCLHTPAPASA